MLRGGDNAKSQLLADPVAPSSPSVRRHPTKERADRGGRAPAEHEAAEAEVAAAAGEEADEAEAAAAAAGEDSATCLRWDPAGVCSSSRMSANDPVRRLQA